jgi:hypothetical protein
MPKWIVSMQFEIEAEDDEEVVEKMNEQIANGEVQDALYWDYRELEESNENV